MTALNCQTATACQEMLATKRRWGKTCGVLGYHLIHSYAPGEVTPEQAHAAGVEFARRLLGDRYEVVIATHVDRDHLHCHILFNSVSFVDGKKYRNSFKDYFGDIRETSNQVNREQGLSTIQPQGKGKPYPAWRAEQSGRPTLRSLVREDIDRAVRQAFTLQSLWRILESWGYDIKQGQHLAVRPPGGKRFLRLESLGPGYTEAVLLQRIARNRINRVDRTRPKKLRYRGLWQALRPRPRLQGFRALYYRYLYLLRGKPHRPAPFVVRGRCSACARPWSSISFCGSTTSTLPPSWRISRRSWSSRLPPWWSADSPSTGRAERRRSPISTKNCGPCGNSCGCAGSLPSESPL